MYSSYQDNILGADLVNIQLLSKCSKGAGFLLCIIDTYGKYASVVPLKDKKDIIITSAFQNFFDNSGCNPNKIWVEEGSGFYKRPMKSWLHGNGIDGMYSTNNEGKSVIVERFIRTLKTKIYKHMPAISKNVYIDKLEEIVDKYNNTSHRTAKMKLADVKVDTYIDFDVENDKNPDLVTM